jgi:hypothetical protein
MERIKVVLILGSGHNGGTLTDLLLDSHSQMLGIGEFHAGRASCVCSCGKPAPECAVWQRALGPLPWREQGIFKKKLDYLFNRGVYRCAKGAPAPVDEAQFITSNLVVFRTLLADRKKTIIVDSSKEVERAEVLSKSPEIEPIVIHMVRDGRGSTWTYIAKYRKILPYFYMWAFSNLKAELLRRRFKRLAQGRGKFIYVRFEDLVNEPEKTLRFLCDEIGVVYESGMLRFDEHEHHQIEGNRTRFVKGHTIYPDTKPREMPTYLRLPFMVLFGWLNFYYRHKRTAAVA